MFNNLKEYYTKEIERLTSIIDSKKSIQKRLTLILLSIYAISIYVVYYFWSNWNTISVLSIPLISVFIAVFIFKDKIKKTISYYTIAKTNIVNELNALNGDYSSFDSAPEMINRNHSFSNDLDLFGKDSIFQRINRTVTIGGKRDLIHSFLFPNHDIQTIKKRQIAIKELESLIDFRDRFRILGSTENLLSDKVLESYSSLRKKNKIQNTKWKYLPLISSSLFLTIVLLSILGLISDLSIFVFFILMININDIVFKKNNSKIISLNQFTTSLNSYTMLLKEIENQPFDSEVLNDLKMELLNNEASLSISHFSYLCDSLNQSYNIFGKTILNPILSWNILFLIRIEKWISKNQNLLISCFRVTSKFDSLISLSIFSFNNPSNIYPIITNEKVLIGKDIYHPFIGTDNVIKNDINIIRKPFFYIITGGNMSGKSTYLRSIGINMLFSCIGLPVFAKSFNCYPYKLFTSINMSDSLSNNESYFLAELRRLKKIIDDLQSGEELFIILDELLRGTNSIDKLKGSFALIERLICLQGCGLITSHNTELGKLKEKFPLDIGNYKFETCILKDKLSFTYKLEEGISANTNACFLMKRMNIISEDI